MFLFFNQALASSRDSTYIVLPDQNWNYKFNPKLKNSKALGVNVEVDLIGKNGNLYYRASFCNSGARLLLLAGIIFQK